MCKLYAKDISYHRLLIKIKLLCISLFIQLMILTDLEIICWWSHVVLHTPLAEEKMTDSLEGHRQLTHVPHGPRTSALDCHWNVWPASLESHILSLFHFHWSPCLLVRMPYLVK